MFKTTLKAIFIFSLFFIFARSANAAVLYVSPSTGNFSIGAEFSVDIKINSEDESINAAQATINWPAGILQFVEASKFGSTFNFWVTDPVLSDAKNSVSFIGGTAKGVTGGALQVLRVRFKTLGAGPANISLTDAAVTASDGQGTNVLSQITGASYTVGATVVQPIAPPPSATTETPAPQVVQPVLVKRIAVPSTKLPVKPVLQVPLYPDETRWYDHLAETVVLWELPPDVVQVATRLSHAPDTLPGTKEPELMTGKSFGTLEEGVWFIRVQFRNNIGWGPMTYYKISIDTTAPLPFEISMDVESSDNPSPTLHFETQDSLSGIAYALVFIDDKSPVEVSSTEFVLPPQLPGQHTVLIRVFDKADNSAEDDITFEVLPLPSPTIDFITKTISQGEPLFVSGKTIPNTFIDFNVIDSKNNQRFTGRVISDGVGGWETSIAEALSTGKYTLVAIARDERGAVSLPVESPVFQVKPKVIISLGGIDLGWLEILVIGILLVVTLASVGGWYYISSRKMRNVYRVIVGRDIDKLCDLLTRHLNDLEGLQEQHDPSISAKALALTNKMKDTVDKMKKYIGEEVRRLK